MHTLVAFFSLLLLLLLYSSSVLLLTLPLGCSLDAFHPVGTGILLASFSDEEIELQADVASGSRNRTRDVHENDETSAIAASITTHAKESIS